MVQWGVAGRRSTRAALVGLAAAGLLVGLASTADARRFRGHGHAHQARHVAKARIVAHHGRVHARLPVESGNNFSSIVVDANTGRMLYGRSENELRHPASITKVMTLYLLFEQLEKGRLRLDSDINVSAHAASQSPTKLGVPAGRTIMVEDAIKAICTRSANDMAVAVAEAVGGDEDTFADMMTNKARALGMSRTVYRNASGLPNEEQVTTAHDLALLGRSIAERFPRYYRYFSTHVFYYRGQAIANHNHLMERTEGMDGIKTGYTRASGFNLLSSVHRDGRWIVSVVMGGRSAAGRDRIMAGLIDEHMANASSTRSAPMVAETPVEPVRREAKVVVAPAPATEARSIAKPIPVKVETSPIQLASADVTVPAARPRPAFVAGTARPDERALTTQSVPQRTADGSTASAAPAATSTPSNLRWVAGPSAAKERKPEPQKVAKLETIKVEPAPREREAPKTPASVRTGWMIQIGATDNAEKASELLARARSHGNAVPRIAQPLTEKVQRGSGTLYRARFAGLEADSAEAACKSLKRAGFACFATKN